MQDFLNRLFALVTSLEFLVGTLICGLVLSVAGAALYDWGKALLGRFSARQRTRNDAMKEWIAREGEKCAVDPSYLNIRIHDTDYWSVWAGMYLVAGFVLLGMIATVLTTLYCDGLSRLLDSDVSISAFATIFTQPYILQIPVTRSELWFRVGMPFAYIPGCLPGPTGISLYKPIQQLQAHYYQCQEVNQGTPGCQHQSRPQRRIA